MRKKTIAQKDNYEKGQLRKRTIAQSTIMQKDNYAKRRLRKKTIPQNTIVKKNNSATRQLPFMANVFFTRLSFCAIVFQPALNRFLRPEWLTRCREMVTQSDHFCLTSDFLVKYLTDLKNFSSFENVVLSSFQFYSFLFLKNSKLSTLISLFLSFRQSKSRKEGRKCDSSYQETHFSEKIPENKAIRQKWSL